MGSSRYSKHFQITGFFHFLADVVITNRVVLDNYNNNMRLSSLSVPQQSSNGMCTYLQSGPADLHHTILSRLDLKEAFYSCFNDKIIILCNHFSLIVCVYLPVKWSCRSPL